MISNWTIEIFSKSYFTSKFPYFKNIFGCRVEIIYKVASLEIWEYPKKWVVPKIMYWNQIWNNIKHSQTWSQLSVGPDVLPKWQNFFAGRIFDFWLCFDPCGSWRFSWTIFGIFSVSIWITAVGCNRGIVLEMDEQSRTKSC